MTDQLTPKQREAMEALAAILDHAHDRADDHEKTLLEGAHHHVRTYILNSTPVTKPDISDEAIATVWRAAMTAACNVVIERQNRLRDNDGPTEVLYEQGRCLEGIKAWLEIDDVFLSEVRGLIAAAPTPEDRHD